MPIGDLEQVFLEFESGVPDSYSRLTSLPLEIVDGIMEFTVADTTMRISSSTRPTDSQSGQTFTKTERLTFGPNVGPGAGYRLDAMWFKEAVAAAGAIVTFQGIVRRAG